MIINKWIWFCSIYLVWCVICIVINILDIVVNHHFPIGALFNVLSLFIAVMFLEDMLDFKRFLKEKGH